MPGISLNCSKLVQEKLLLEALNSLVHNEHYNSEVILNNDPYFVGYTKYEDYPIQIFESDKLWICLEGRIYGKEKSLINRELYNLLNSIFDDGISDKITNWLLETDGEFVIYVLNKTTKDFLVLNDALGRLPTYYYINHDKVIVSRELQFIINLVEDPQLDIMGIAQSLLFCYPLGKKTLVDNINRLEPASIIRISENGSKNKVDHIYSFNFEKKADREDITIIVDELISLLSQACKNRAGLCNENILSLSGGRDSRAVAAALHNNKIPFVAATYVNSDKRSIIDSEIAEKVAMALNISWEKHDLHPPEGRDLNTLLDIKYGLNYLAMSFILQFFEALRQRHGPGITYFTGDGGDKVLPNLNPFQRFKNLHELASYIISTNHVFSVYEVAQITRVPESEIIDEVVMSLSSYPETNLNQKYVHFLIYERAFKWLFEGEDRNRFYFWSVTPFYSIPFFKCAMECPDKIKSEDTLYKKFLEKLVPVIAVTDYAGRPFLGTNRYIGSIKRQFFPLYVRLSKLSYNEGSNIIKCLQQQIDNCKSISNYISDGYLVKLIKNSSYYHKHALDNLFTITSIIEKLCCKDNTITKYYDTHQFI